MCQVEKFEDVASRRFALVEFFTTWCGPCKAQKTVLQDVEKSNDGLLFASIDIESNFELSERLHIGTVPTTILFENGEEKGRVVGFQQKDKIESLIGATVPA